MAPFSQSLSGYLQEGMILSYKKFQAQTTQFDSCINFLEVSALHFLIINSVKEEKDGFSNQSIFYESLYQNIRILDVPKVRVSKKNVEHLSSEME